MSAEDEPGLTVAEDGMLVYAWPPEGRFRELWGRFEAQGFTEEEVFDLTGLLNRKLFEDGEVVAYSTEDGWVDVDWEDVPGWVTG